MSDERRSYSKEYKMEAVRRSNEPDVKASDVARELGIRPELLYRWRSEMNEHGETHAFPGHGHPQENDLEAENRRLRKQVEQLEEDYEILKKAIRIFSQEKK